VSFELLFAGSVLIVGGVLQIRVQRWSQAVPPRQDDEAEPSSGEDGPALGSDAGAGRARGLWVQWTGALGVISIVFGVVVLLVAATR
jgi:uncharacterized membrane protein HdeD (DUF308 family)